MASSRPAEGRISPGAECSHDVHVPSLHVISSAVGPQSTT